MSVCEVVHYCAGSNGTEVSVHYTWNSRVSIVEKGLNVLKSRTFRNICYIAR